jgi:dihydropteroate synthase
MTENKAKDSFFSRKLSLNCRGKLLTLEQPRIMGILNITPDSFYDGGKYADPVRAMERIGEMIKEGADIIDIGAASSRPGAGLSNPEEEMERLAPLGRELRNAFPEQVFSIDTYHARVAKAAVEEHGFDMVNDISSGSLDPGMHDAIAAMNVPYVLMHMKGIPGNMQMNPEYANVTDEIIQYFAGLIHHMRERGISDIIIDPGFGFGKSLDHNFELVANFEAFAMLETPILAGVSRKSMISKLLGLSSNQALNGTTAVHMLLLEKGVNILRVHDVAEAKEAVTVFTKARSSASSAGDDFY